MVKVIGILGDIGSGKSFIAKQFGYPVFNADQEVNKIYKKNKSCYKKLRNKLPKYIKSYPISKVELSKAILANKHNLKKIVNVVHPLVRYKMNYFLRKNFKKKIIAVGLAYSSQKYNGLLPLEKTDEKLDAILTESGFNFF